MERLRNLIKSHCPLHEKNLIELYILFIDKNIEMIKKILEKDISAEVLREILSLADFSYKDLESKIKDRLKVPKEQAYKIANQEMLYNDVCVGMLENILSEDNKKKKAVEMWTNEEIENYKKAILHDRDLFVKAIVLSIVKGSQILKEFAKSLAVKHKRTKSKNSNGEIEYFDDARYVANVYNKVANKILKVDDITLMKNRLEYFIGTIIAQDPLNFKKILEKNLAEGNFKQLLYQSADYVPSKYLIEVHKFINSFRPADEIDEVEDDDFSIIQKMIEECPIKPIPMIYSELKDVCIIFESYEDKSSESVIRKIRYNHEKTKLFLQEAESVLQPIGLYGDFKSGIALTQLYLGREVPELHGFVNEKSFEGILAIREGKRMVFIYKSSEKCSPESSELLASYIRYLMDYCEMIYALPGQGEWHNPDESPFKAYCNPSFSLKLEVNSEKKDLDLQNFPGENTQNLYYHVFNDLTNNLFTIDFVNNFIELTFHNIFIPRDTGDSPVDYKLQPNSCTVKFSLHEYTSGIERISLQFVTPTNYLFLIKSLRERKATLYHGKLEKSGINTQGKLQNLDYDDPNLIVDSKSMRWCIYEKTGSKIVFGKLDSNGKIGEESSITFVYEETIDGHTINGIISATFQTGKDSIFFLNQDGVLFELMLKNLKLRIVYSSEQKKIVPANGGDKFLEIQCDYSGNNFFMRTKNRIEVFDNNWERLKIGKENSLYKESMLHYKVFNDRIDTFLAIFTLENVECYRILGLKNEKIVKQQIDGKKDNKKDRNPILDSIYYAIKKFGPPSSFISCPKRNHLVLLRNKKIKKSQAQKYFDNLNIPTIDFSPSAVLGVEFKKNKTNMNMEYKIDKEILQMILDTRVPIHVATIENNNLMPLCAGINQSSQISTMLKDKNERECIRILSEFINFGPYEELIKNHRDEVYVVVIVGRQTSGKSYGLNRIFGTRFDVAATRCTDGIWLSVSKLKVDNNKEKFFIVMDCEGLFSIKRNETEETKLCLTLAAVADVFILNQDLTFNRHLNQMFSNFDKEMGKFKGDKFFKGFMLMLIRDVRSGEAGNAYRELSSNLVQLRAKKNGSLSKMFQGTLMANCMNYYQLPVFQKEIEFVRRTYFSNLETKRWRSGAEFLSNFKSALIASYSAKIHDRLSSKDSLELSNRKMEEYKVAFFQGDEAMYGKNTLKKTFNMKGKLFEMELDLGKLTGVKIFDLKNEIEIKESAENVMKWLINEFGRGTCLHSEEIDDAWRKNFKDFASDFMSLRYKALLKHYEEMLSSKEEFKEIKIDLIKELDRSLDIYLEKCLSFLKKL